ncbi:type II toxin-antitoxin system VapC family toxin [Actinokineospora sp. UTMC 2448]|uniref:type II toxin-antitoxin system VapC family toxin n=1 Tax=Actinokineospora sp. UTMC 2448 TaxID=2268449 RepID=UPI002164D100|nr:type II toxin-antitoxin system VapC family toxin [Actinokineospora sp. UTMC 2448]UVS82221.1 putative ribonuclease VapC35 [Actinokineospora sp. UTMC 2448]
MIYLDSCAVIKLVHNEDHSSDLVAWLNAPGRSGAQLVSSVLVEVETVRALRRSAPAALPGIPAVLARLYRVQITDVIRATAAAYPEATLRTLDAIHLATAQVVVSETATPLSAFVTYDKRLLDSAVAAGLPVAAPGMVT